jgi:uncharacterized lipoprotein YajG
MKKVLVVAALLALAACEKKAEAPAAAPPAAAPAMTDSMSAMPDSTMARDTAHKM